MIVYYCSNDEQWRRTEVEETVGGGDGDVLEAVPLADDGPAGGRGEEVSLPSQELHHPGQPGLGDVSSLPLHL